MQGYYLIQIRPLRNNHISVQCHLSDICTHVLNSSFLHSIMQYLHLFRFEFYINSFFQKICKYYLNAFVNFFLQKTLQIDNRFFKNNCSQVSFKIRKSPNHEGLSFIYAFTFSVFEYRISVVKYRIFVRFCQDCFIICRFICRYIVQTRAEYVYLK